MSKNLRPYWNRLKKNPPSHPEYSKNLKKMRMAMQQQLPLPAQMACELLDHFLAPPINVNSLYRVEEVIDILLEKPADDSNSLLGEKDMHFMIDLINLWAVQIDMNAVTAFMRAALRRGYL